MIQSMYIDGLLISTPNKLGFSVYPQPISLYPTTISLSTHANAYQQLQRSRTNHLGESTDERGQRCGGGAVGDSVRLDAGHVSAGVDGLSKHIKVIQEWIEVMI